jgi:hypothetical protein
MDAVSTDQPDDQRAPADYAESVALPAVTSAVPVVVSGTDWWAARPAGSRLVGLVVARRSAVGDRAARCARRLRGADRRLPPPRPRDGESWAERLNRLFGRLVSGDVVVVADKHALGRTVDEETHAIAELRRRGIIVKVLGHSRS